MKKINELSEINCLIKRHFIKNVYTNNFISEESYEREIQRGTLYFLENEDGLFVFRKREGFSVMNFHLHNEFTLPSIEEKIVCEIPFKGEKRYDDSFSKNGFSIALHRIRMTAVNPLKSCGKIYTVDVANAEKAYDFLKENFSKYTGCIPVFDEFLKDVSEKKVLYNGGDDIGGILHFGIKGKTSEIRHLAVSQDMRRKGIAGNLINAFFEVNDSRKFQVWLTKDNIAALNLYEKYGFKADGFESLVYTKGI